MFTWNAQQLPERHAGGSSLASRISLGRDSDYRRNTSLSRRRWCRANETVDITPMIAPAHTQRPAAVNYSHGLQTSYCSSDPVSPLSSMTGLGRPASPEQPWLTPRIRIRSRFEDDDMSRPDLPLI